MGREAVAGLYLNPAIQTAYAAGFAVFLMGAAAALAATRGMTVNGRST